VLRFRTLIRRARLLGLGVVVSVAVAAPSSAQAYTPGYSSSAGDGNDSPSTPANFVVRPNRSSWT
jgi:hypothetical protein